MTERLIQGNHSFWAITSYFNPAGYNKRRENYEEFRNRLDVPLLTIELAYGAKFELDQVDADIIVQLRGEDVMWQKERLLNIALAALPSSCSKVAWIDCDVVFENTGWPEDASKKLDQYPIIQLFDQVHYLSRNSVLVPFHKASKEASRAGFAAAVESGIPVIDCLEHAFKRTFGHYAPGLAWAAQRKLVEEHGLYDACILGAGDRALVCAAYGTFKHSVRFNKMTSEEKSYYLTWAKPFYEDTQGQVGYIGGNLWHLWHGSLKDRRYGTRHADMSYFAFDPLKDLEMDENELWRWKSAKPDMHQFVRDFFSSRKEDG